MLFLLDLVLFEECTALNAHHAVDPLLDLIVPKLGLLGENTIQRVQCSLFTLSKLALVAVEQSSQLLLLQLTLAVGIAPSCTLLLKTDG